MSNNQSLTPKKTNEKEATPFRVQSEWPFFVCFGIISLFYIAMILAMLIAETTYTTPEQILHFLSTPEIRYSTRLSLLSCAVSTLLALWVAVPIGYLMSRFQFFGKSIIDAILDIPIVLPPLVIGLCLLILFSSPLSLTIENQLHSLESWAGNNLVPLTIGLLIIILFSCLYRLTRNLIRLQFFYRLLLVVTCCTLFIASTRGSLFPNIPNWFPVLSEFDQNSFILADQFPLRLSRHVYEARYSYTGSGNSLKRLTLQQVQKAKHIENIKLIPQHGDDGSQTGSYLISAVFGEGIDDRFPDGGEIEIHAVPQKPTEQLKSLQLQINQAQSQLENLKRNRNLLEGEFNSDDYILQMRKQSEALQKKWKSATLDQTIAGVEKSLQALEISANQTRQTIESLQSNESSQSLNKRIEQFKTALITLKPGAARDVVEQEYNNLLEQKVLISKLENSTQSIRQSEEAIRELTAEQNRLNNSWRTELTEWKITLHALRPKLSSKPDLKPSLVIPVTYEIPSVILAQFMVACAFAVRTMRVTFDQIHPRLEQVALTLGCSRGQAFWRVVFPQAWRGLMAAGTLAWARSLGEFGPILIFAGATRMKTEVLPTSVFLEFSTGQLSGAVAASLIIIAAAMIVLVIARFLGLRKMTF